MMCPGMALNSPCRDFVTWWTVGTCPPAWNGPWLPIWVLWVTELGPWLDAWPSGVCVGLGSRTKVLILLGPAAKVQAGFLG